MVDDVTGDAAAEWVPIESLKPWAKNPRKNDGVPVQKVADSIRRFGFGAVIVARKADGEIIAGHTRWKAAKLIGMQRVPVRYLDIDEREAHLLALADNRLNEIAEWDSELLADVVEDEAFTPDEIDTAGWDQESFTELLDTDKRKRKADDDDVQPPAKPITQPGDLWILGDHMLLCGSAVEPDDVAKVMGSAKAALIFTDPPYGVAYTGGSKKRDALQGDRTTGLYEPALALAAQHALPDVAAYVWHASSKTIEVLLALKLAGYEHKATIIWAKNHAQFGGAGMHADYHQKHEPCWYGQLAGHKARWFGPANETTVWEYARASKNEYHPTQKPVELAARAIANSTLRGEVVLDMFGGSGSTLIAAEQTGRHARLIELEPGYCDVIVKRWETATGCKAERAQ